MKFKHHRLDELYRAYATTAMEIDGETVALFASEEKDYPCYMYSGENFDKRSTVWEKGGGCMSIIPIPNRKNEFLAIVDFYLKVSPSKAKLIWGKYENGEWEFKDVISLPFLHRFDIYPINGVNYVVLATIADDKDFKDDWSRSGSIYYARLPENPSEGLSLKRVEGHYFRNHGYYRRDEGSQIYGYFGSDEGIFKLKPSYQEDWTIEKVLEGPVGEIAFMDINGDGIDEMMTIEPFHGNEINIYEHKNGKYIKVYTYPNTIDFAHTLIGATLAGIPSFVAGVRRIDTELFAVQYIDGEYVSIQIDNGGSANVAYAKKNGKDVILSSNHTRNECAYYIFEE